MLEADAFSDLGEKHTYSYRRCIEAEKRRARIITSGQGMSGRMKARDRSECVHF